MVTDAADGHQGAAAGGGQVGHQTGAGEEGGVVISGAILIGPLRAIAQYCGVDQAGEAALELLIGEPHALQGLLPEVGQQHVRPLQQLHHGLLPALCTQIQRDKALVQILHVEVGVGIRSTRREGGTRLLAPGVAVERLHLDHVGSPLGQNAGAHGPRQHGGQFHNLDSFQWFHINQILLLFCSNSFAALRGSGNTRGKFGLGNTNQNGKFIFPALIAL